MLNRIEATRRKAEQLRPKQASSRINADLQDFIPKVSPLYQPPKHLQIVTDHLERTLTEPVFIAFSVPPRHFKTETVLHYIAWYLSQKPHHTVGYTSYAQTFAESKALKAHRYAKLAGVSEDPKMANRAEWRTAQGGGILTTGIGGPLTGQGLNVAVIDDPLKNREEADSPTIREKHWGWFEDVLETRLEPGASVLAFMTRWHEDDLLGRIAKYRPEYTIIRLPALADCLDSNGKHPAPDPLGRSEGEALLESRYSADQLSEVKRKKPYTFASLYQGLPRPREGRLFSEPTFYKEIPSGVRYSIGVDLAYTAKARADHSAAVVIARVGDTHYIKHVERWQAEIGESIKRLKRLQATYNARIATEGNGPQKAIVDTLKASGLRVKADNPVNDKYSRAQPAAEAWNAGRLQVPESAPWLGEFLEEIGNFTGASDPEDDQVDALSLAFEEKRPTNPEAAKALTNW